MPILDDILKGTDREVSRQPTELNPKPERKENVPSYNPKALTPSAIFNLPKVTDAAPPQVQIKERDARAIAEQTRPLTYVELLHKLSPYQPPSQEQIERDRKRQRSSETIAAIGDGIRAISNLVATTHYAPNAYRPGESMQGKMRERWDQLQAQRKAEADAYYRAYLQARNADDSNERARAHLQAQREKAQQDFIQNIAKQKADHERWRAELGLKAGELEQKAKERDEDRKFKQEQFSETKRHNRASEAEARARTGAMYLRHASGGGRGGDSYYVDFGEDEDGEDLGGVEIPKENLNDVNVGQVYNLLPEELRTKYLRQERKAGKIIYTNPKPREMLQIIGQNIGNPEIRNALERLKKSLPRSQAEPPLAPSDAPSKKAYGVTSTAPATSKGRGY